MDNKGLVRCSDCGEWVRLWRRDDLDNWDAKHERHHNCADDPNEDELNRFLFDRTEARGINQDWANARRFAL